MRTGFTGTRWGMSRDQKETLGAMLSELGITEFDHGDCVGADTEAAELAYAHGIALNLHPPLDEEFRAFTNDRLPHVEVFQAKTHFARNRAIVDVTECLLATPFENTRQPRGGTWYTIDYAIKKGRNVYIIWPTGVWTVLSKGKQA